MNVNGILINKNIPDGLFTKLENLCAEVCDKEEKILFAIVGDLTLDAKYGTNVLAVTKKRSITVDGDGNLLLTALHSDVEKAKVKRMYGNARLMLTLKDETPLEMFRFTYAVANLCDMAAE